MTMIDFLSVLKRGADRLQNLKGWPRSIMAFAFGAVMSFAMPPYNLFPLLWFSMPVLLLLLRGCERPRTAFTTGWSFAFGFLAFSLYWIAASMFVDIAHFWWAVPLAVAGLPALFALYYGLASTLAYCLGLSGLQGALNLALWWFIADYVRGHAFTGFPWNFAAYAWSGLLPVLQSVSLFGIYGLNLLTLLAAALPAPALRGERGGRLFLLASLVLLLGLSFWGVRRLQNTQITLAPHVRLRLVQPNIAQSGKWNASERAKDFQDLINLSTSPSEQPITHIIWPETASTYYLTEDATLRSQITNQLSKDALLLTGVLRRDLDLEGNTRFYNSLIVLDGTSRVVADYDKAHLVPFGEYMPLRAHIPLHALAASDIDFSAGPGPRSLRVAGLPPFSPLICYEVIFPSAITDTKDRPGLLVNVTNDAWYGDTIGPYQHFAIARSRAIEEGLPLVRAANTGISGVIDPLGHIVSSLNLNKRGILDENLPNPLPLTFYGMLGDTPVLVVVLVLLLISVFKRWRPAAIR